MGRLLIIATALAASLFAAAGGSASEGSEPGVGARVRVTAATDARPPAGGDETARRFVGTLVSLDGQALVVKLKKQEDALVVPRSSVQRLEVSRRSSRKAAGALMGFLIGTAGGALAASLSGGSSACDSTGLSGCDLAIAAVVIGLPGALVGTLVAPGERWEAVPLGPLGLSVAPTRDHGVKAAISLSF